jgi:aryl-alcohol dehydrogenase-like predicted oxidoreductase
LAWVLAKHPFIVPIPGTKRVKYLEDNMGAWDVHLSPEDMRAIEAVFPLDVAAGPRYPTAYMSAVNR